MDTMESGDVKINFITKTFSTVTSPSPLNLNNVCITFSKRYKKSPIGKSVRSVPWTGFDPASPLPVSQINLKLSYNEFTPIHLFPLINTPLQNRPLSKYIAEAIAARAYLSVGLLHSMLMSVDVIITQTLFAVTPAVSCLAEEETREGENKSTCPICLENLLNDDDNIDDKIRKLPHCLHRFHKECISEWLIRCDSCPLCRKSVLQESQ